MAGVRPRADAAEVLQVAGQCSIAAWEDYELSSRNLTLCTAISVICFESFPQVFDTMPRDVRDQCVGFRARPRSNHGFRGCDDYFDLRFPYRFQPDSVPL
ncbi:hypothetical protein DY000_02041407 [Brassica cretica]|uniref:Uncharacterized protein n=1 Tax=Brassica cretica TaxID=69181 RepID=A0ABQ7BIU5_BRACR|nr:hypothetical protein DY000_02041407 [Brassica cretica]